MATSAFQSILVPVDGSAASDGALRLALRLVARDGEIIIAHAIDRAEIIAQCMTPYGGDAHPALEAQESAEREIFARASEHARAAVVAFSTVSLNGSAVSCIASLAANRDVDAIVMGTHGRTGVARLVLGNTAAGVMRQTSVPVFIVHECNAELSAGPLKTILVALDNSPASCFAAHAAVDVAAAEGGRVVFAHVASPTEHVDVAGTVAGLRAYALAAGVPSEGVVLEGPPVDAIITGVRAYHADLIAIGKYGGVKKPFGFGSIAQAIVRMSPVPVLVMPAPATTSMSRPSQDASFALK